MKNIIIITQGLSRIVMPVINFSGCRVIGIVECSPRIQNEKKSFVFEVAKYIYHSFIHPKERTLKSFALSKGIPYFYMQSSGSDLEDWIKKLNPDLMIVYSMSQLLKKNIYTLPRYGTINLHPSYLPEYRGPNPCFWMYYNMDRQGGVTIHFIDEGEDTGKIILQERFDIPLGIKSPDKFDFIIDKIGIRLLLEAIANIEHLAGKEQPLKSPTLRARNLKSDEHQSIINWNEWPIERIWHVLRGTELWLNALPCPTGLYCGTRWIIEEYDKMEYDGNLIVGRIYKNNGRNFVVCKDGIIYLDCKVNIKCLVNSVFSLWNKKK